MRLSIIVRFKVNEFDANFCTEEFYYDSIEECPDKVCRVLTSATFEPLSEFKMLKRGYELKFYKGEFYKTIHQDKTLFGDAPVVVYLLKEATPLPMWQVE